MSSFDFCVLCQCLNVLICSNKVLGEAVGQKYSNSWAVQLQNFTTEVDLRSLAKILGLNVRKVRWHYSFSKLHFVFSSNNMLFILYRHLVINVFIIKATGVVIVIDCTYRISWFGFYLFWRHPSISPIVLVVEKRKLSLKLYFCEKQGEASAYTVYSSAQLSHITMWWRLSSKYQYNTKPYSPWMLTNLVDVSTISSHYNECCEWNMTHNVYAV